MSRQGSVNNKLARHEFRTPLPLDVRKFTFWLVDTRSSCEVAEKKAEIWRVSTLVPEGSEATQNVLSQVEADGPGSLYRVWHGRYLFRLPRGAQGRRRPAWVVRGRHSREVVVRARWALLPAAAAVCVLVSRGGPPTATRFAPSGSATRSAMRPHQWPGFDSAALQPALYISYAPPVLGWQSLGGRAYRGRGVL